MTEEIKDNLEEVTNELAEALAAIQIEGSRHKREAQSYVILQKFGTDCNIEARYDVRSISEVITDNYGNEFVPMDLHVMVTYPSHGGDEVELVYDRTRFLKKCCIEALKLRNEFTPKPVFCLLRSAAQKRQREHEKSAEVVRLTIVINCKGMRIGASKRFCDRHFSDQLVPGIYDISIDKRRYTADVSDSKVVTVVRRPLES
ncbi:hypothetical protein M0R72_00965 [Candidatus Pacearchaeota archaeon]|nr:hypothetical protein [Candidatus Pacearchaeota archaeon]